MARTAFAIIVALSLGVAIAAVPSHAFIVYDGYSAANCGGTHVYQLISTKSCDADTCVAGASAGSSIKQTCTSTKPSSSGLNVDGTYLLFAQFSGSSCTGNQYISAGALTPGACIPLLSSTNGFPGYVKASCNNGNGTIAVFWDPTCSTPWGTAASIDVASGACTTVKPVDAKYSFTGSCVSTKGGVALPLSSPSSAGKTSIGAVAAAAVAVGAAALLL